MLINLKSIDAKIIVFINVQKLNFADHYEKQMKKKVNISRVKCAISLLWSWGVTNDDSN